MGKREMGGHWSSQEKWQISTLREENHQQVQKENNGNAFYLQKPHG